MSLTTIINGFLTGAKVVAPVDSAEAQINVQNTNYGQPIKATYEERRQVQDNTFVDQTEGAGPDPDLEKAVHSYKRKNIRKLIKSFNKNHKDFWNVDSRFNHYHSSETLNLPKEGVTWIPSYEGLTGFKAFIIENNGNTSIRLYDAFNPNTYEEVSFKDKKIINTGSYTKNKGKYEKTGEVNDIDDFLNQFEEIINDSDPNLLTSIEPKCYDNPVKTIGLAKLESELAKAIINDPNAEVYSYDNSEESGMFGRVHKKVFGNIEITIRNGSPFESDWLKLEYTDKDGIVFSGYEGGPNIVAFSSTELTRNSLDLLRNYTEILQSAIETYK
jgi:hypothetical protein